VDELGQDCIQLQALVLAAPNFHTSYLDKMYGVFPLACLREFLFLF
jgi:hypothetical protein